MIYLPEQHFLLLYTTCCFRAPPWLLMQWYINTVLRSTTMHQRMTGNTDVLLLIHKAITLNSSVYMDIHDYDVYLNKSDKGLCVKNVSIATNVVSSNPAVVFVIVW